MKKTPDPSRVEPRTEPLADQLRRQARAMSISEAPALRRRIMQAIEGAPVPSHQAPRLFRLHMMALAALLMAILGGWLWMGSEPAPVEPAAMPDFVFWAEPIPFEPASMIDRPLIQEATALKNDLAGASRHLMLCVGLDG
jgi:hypothetical protein